VGGGGGEWRGAASGGSGAAATPTRWPGASASAIILMVSESDI
jgi:hypothetical protein